MKNKRSMIIIIAMVLLLAVVLGMGGATFAKYITQMDPVSESATVAKWGYTLTASPAGLFGNDYAYDTSISKVTDSTASLTVSASTDNKDIVAPGTTGSMELHINGSAEVLSSFSITATGTDISVAADTVDIDGNGTLNALYNPIVWTITGNATYTVPGGSATGIISDKISTDGNTVNLTTAELLNALNALDSFETASKLAPNTELDIDLTLTWTWAFENAQDGANIMDTYLGTQGTQTLGLTINATIEQLAQYPN